MNSKRTERDSTPQRFLWISFAASLLVLIAAGVWWLNSNQMAVTPQYLLGWEDASEQRGFDDER